MTGELRAAVSQACGRCLEPCPGEVTAPVDVRLVPRPATADNVELAPDDLDVDFYDKDEVDIGALIEAETTLALPMKPLCREGCLGSVGFAVETGMWSSASAQSARPIHGWPPSRTWPRGFRTRRIRCLCRNDVTRRHADASAARTTSSPRPTRSVCPQCRETKLPHRVCPHCGYYKGREIVAVEGT